MSLTSCPAGPFSRAASALMPKVGCKYTNYLETSKEKRKKNDGIMQKRYATAITMKCRRFLFQFMIIRGLFVGIRVLELAKRQSRPTP